jgi:hypothetical protein
MLTLNKDTAPYVIAPDTTAVIWCHDISHCNAGYEFRYAIRSSLANPTVPEVAGQVDKALGHRPVADTRHWPELRC